MSKMGKITTVGILATLLVGSVMSGCSSADDGKPADVGGTPVSNDTKERLQVADDTIGGESSNNNTNSAATPPPPDGN